MGAVILTISIWAAHFTLVYGFTALACARSFAFLVPWVVVPVSIAAVAGIAWIVFPRKPALFTDALAFGLGALALIAIVWEASSVLLPACA
jgi:hypothetical protein